ncbi:MAG TPA: glycerol-3-phosphate 1-O-acyltransferase PlsY [Candidatus Cybelea sp.]|nr:glycerol-3-phosphate 1-O-acyltransferase PlsY [Candidatus Cybelea sp.]
MDIGAYIFVVVISYLLGATPSGYLVGKACGIDVRTAGSGNIGATNVVRILGRNAGAVVLTADALKGFVAARWIPLLALHLCPSLATPRENLALVGGVAAILGHVYTFWLYFKGGKGIATSGGVVMAWAPLACLTALAVWGLVLAMSKYVSLASIAAAVVLPFAVWFWNGSTTMTLAMTGLSLLAIYKHKMNIQRLLKGSERRIGTRET